MARLQRRRLGVGGVGQPAGPGPVAGRIVGHLLLVRAAVGGGVERGHGLQVGDLIRVQVGRVAAQRTGAVPLREGVDAGHRVVVGPVPGRLARVVVVHVGGGRHGQGVHRVPAALLVAELLRPVLDLGLARVAAVGQFHDAEHLTVVGGRARHRGHLGGLVEAVRPQVAVARPQVDHLHRAGAVDPAVRVAVGAVVPVEHPDDHQQRDHHAPEAAQHDARHGHAPAALLTARRLQRGDAERDRPHPQQTAEADDAEHQRGDGETVPPGERRRPGPAAPPGVAGVLLGVRPLRVRSLRVRSVRVRPVRVRRLGFGRGVRRRRERLEERVAGRLGGVGPARLVLVGRNGAFPFRHRTAAEQACSTAARI